MIEYLIKRRDGDFLLLEREKLAAVLRPNSLGSREVQGWGDHRIEVAGLTVAFSFEDPGIQLIFENAESVDDVVCSLVVDEIVENVKQKESCDCYAIRLT